MSTEIQLDSEMCGGDGYRDSALFKKCLATYSPPIQTKNYIHTDGVCGSRIDNR